MLVKENMIKPGDNVLVVDIGYGTGDIALIKYSWK